MRSLFARLTAEIQLEAIVSCNFELNETAQTR
jgi:hypothetical protein